ncbi:peptidoglycan-recognition protein SB1-like [Argopecten irradians]|uniref:peptidoglycan-recognition protein SB1-like n=1 Tax=Argopecten irradians TaxID=31199 RepID=UPI0037107B48
MFMLAYLLLIFAPRLVSSTGAAKPATGPSARCQEETTMCKGSYLPQHTCPTNQRYCTDIHHVRSTKECDVEGLHIISRDSWGARSPREPLNTLGSQLSFFIIHHAAGYSCTDLTSCLQQMKEVQKEQQYKKNFSDIAYHYLIGGDGTVFEGRGGKFRGAHSPGYNGKSIGVCLLGNFMTTEPTSKAMASLTKLHTCLMSVGVLSEDNSVFGHRDVRPTACPGDVFYKILPDKFKPYWHRIEPEMWTDCRAFEKGTCKDINKELCTEGTWKSNKCPGPAEIRCCSLSGK